MLTKLKHLPATVWLLEWNETPPASGSPSNSSTRAVPLSVPKFHTSSLTARLCPTAGRSGVMFDVQRATVHVGGVLLFENGLPHDGNAPQAAEHLQQKDVSIVVDLGTGGGGNATVWTCDLSAEYVKINGEYRT